MNIHSDIYQCLYLVDADGSYKQTTLFQEIPRVTFIRHFSFGEMSVAIATVSRALILLFLTLV